MASGTIYGSTGNEYIDAKIEWSSTKDISNNKSTVKAALYYKRNNTGYMTYGEGTFYVFANGISSGGKRTLSITEHSWVKAAEVTTEVEHDDDGTKSIIIWGTGSMPGTTLTSTNVSGTANLGTILRAMSVDSLTCATSYFDGKLTYKYMPIDGDLYCRCNISLNLNGTYIAVKSINLGKQSVAQKTGTVTLSEDELSIIYNKLPSAKNGTLRFTMRSYSDSGYSAQVGDPGHKEITLTIPNTTDTQPTATMTLSPVSFLSSPFNALYIKGRSKVDANFTGGKGKFGADIVSYKMSVGGKSYGSPYTSEYLSTAGTVEVKGTVTDSRGYSRTYTQEITVIDYDTPTLLPASGESKIICARCDAEGNLSESGTYLKIKARRSYSKITADDTQNNYCAIRYRYREESSNTFSDWKTILGKTTTASDTANTSPLSGVVTSTEKAYVVQVGVIDDVGNSSAIQFLIPTAFITIDIPEEHKGRRIGVGRYAEDSDIPGIDMGMPIHGGGVDNLTRGELITATSSSPIDLNNYKTAGNYYSPSADNSKYISNSPYTEGGFGLIVREIQSENMIRQEMFYGRTNWQRHYNGSTGWSDWLRYLMTDEATSTAVDFVTEIGVWNIDDNDTDKGYWRYRKWKSGAVDMNGLIKVFPVAEGTLGAAGVYYSQAINIDLPFEVVNFQFTGSSTSYHIFVGNANGVDGNNKQIRLRLYRFTDFPNLDQYNIYVRIVASGKLK